MVRTSRVGRATRRANSRRSLPVPRPWLRGEQLAADVDRVTMWAQVCDPEPLVRVDAKRGVEGRKPEDLQLCNPITTRSDVPHPCLIASL